MQSKALYVFLLLMTGQVCLAQDSIPAQIHVEERNDSLYFSSHLRPLRQLAGAPASFYTYFWELGDGRFSFDKEPAYAYRDTGFYQVRLYATNNYDDGKAPPTRPHRVRVRKRPSTRDAWVSHFFRGGGIEMKINRYPRPGENFVTVIGYRDQDNDGLSGSIVLFYNERQFGKEGFAMADERFYNKEDSSSLQSLMARLTMTSTNSTLAAGIHGHAGWREADRNPEEEGRDPDAETYNSATQSMLHSMENTYSRNTVLHFQAIKKGDEKFVFLEMSTLPSMIQDTNATVGFSAMLIPDDPALAPEVCQLEMQVVASHDPNRFLFKSRRINYRFFRTGKELSYRIQFQNTGSGPTRKIAIGIGIPAQLDPASFRLNAVAPQCPICGPANRGQSCIDTFSRHDSIFVVFNNIYLPGLQQDGVHNQDSTEGFVEYGIRFRKKPRKIPFGTQATIEFDKHDPIVTNKAMARFIKGLSPGFMAGYSVLPGNGGYSATGPLQFGYVLAPYAPSRPYFQVEAFVGFLQQDAFTSTVVKDQHDTLIGGLPLVVTGRQSITTTQRNSFEITPLHYRYNLNSWIGIGAGTMAQINISQQTTTENKVYLSTQTPPLSLSTASGFQTSAVRYLGNWNAAPFVDLQLGRVRAGPVLGIRYFRLLRGEVPNRFFLYAGFKL